MYLINRSERFRANRHRVENVRKLNNVEIRTNSQVKELVGKDKLNSIVLNSGEELPVDGLFVAIGQIPNLNFLNFKIDLDEHGFIVVDKEMRTSVKNAFACGDILSKHFKQIITACSDGAVAGNSCIGGNI